MVSHELCYLIDTSHLCSEGKKSYFQMTRKGQRKNPKFQNFRLSLIIKKRRNRASEWERERERKKNYENPPHPVIISVHTHRKKIGLLEERGLWLPQRVFSSRYNSKVVLICDSFPQAKLILFCQSSSPRWVSPLSPTRCGYNGRDDSEVGIEGIGGPWGLSRRT